MVTIITAVLLILAYSAGVFFGRANVFSRGSAILKLQKSGGNGATLMLTLNSSQSSCHKIKDDGFNSTNINKPLSTPQNTPALQAILIPAFT